MRQTHIDLVTSRLRLSLPFKLFIQFLDESVHVRLFTIFRCIHVVRRATKRTQKEFNGCSLNDSFMWSRHDMTETRTHNLWLPKAVYQSLFQHAPCMKYIFMHIMHIHSRSCLSRYMCSYSPYNTRGISTSWPPSSALVNETKQDLPVSYTQRINNQRINNQSLWCFWILCNGPGA